MDDYLHHGTAAFRRTNLAMFAAGTATFGLLYCVQPLMPEFSAQFHVGAAESALSLSLPSAVLAVSMLIAGPLSDAYGRKNIMTWSLLSSAAIALATAVAPNWHSFLLLRSLLGLTLAGLPSVGMTYLAEEVHADSIGLGMGLYIGGNAAGGLGGRLIAGIFTDAYGWRMGLAAVGAVGAVATWIFVRSLRSSRLFVPRPLHLESTLSSLRTLWRDAGLPWLFLEGFVLLGSFVTVYNYIGYRLMAPPYSLTRTAVSMIFGVYLVGMFSSSWIGHLAGRLGRRKVLWAMFVLMLVGLGLSLFSSMGLIVAGVIVITFGFFGGHSIVASWVGQRARYAKAHASSVYMFVYYLGGGLWGAIGGLFYSRYGWTGVANFVAALAATGLWAAWRLYHVAPLPRAQVIPMDSLAP